MGGREGLRALALALWVSSCGGAAMEPPAPRHARHVVLVVVDTLRADRVGARAGSVSLTPALDGLAARGVSARAAYATSSWTRPSLASIFTGQLQSAHGVREPRQPLPAGARTLAESLAARGFVTRAVVSNPILRAKWGYGQGFERWDDALALGPDAVTSDEVADSAIAALDVRAGERLFLFALFFDPHWRYRGRTGDAPEPAGRLEGDERTQDLSTMHLDEGELAYVRGLYDAEVRATDAAIGRLLAALEARGLADETLVLVTSDHGEALGERGFFGHVENLDEEVVRVPFVVAGPGVARGSSVDAPLSLACLPATVLELLGVESDAAFAWPSEAEALRSPGSATGPAGSIGSAGSAGSGAVVFEVDYLPTPFRSAARTKQFGVRAGRWKLVVDELSGRRALYDLASDPRGEHDRAPGHPKLVRELEGLLQRLRGAEATRASGGPLTFEERAALEALGY